MPGDWCSFCRWPGRVLLNAAGAMVACRLLYRSTGRSELIGYGMLPEALSRVCRPLANRVESVYD
jgi:hypothetical protein